MCVCVCVCVCVWGETEVMQRPAVHCGVQSITEGFALLFTVIGWDHVFI